MTECIHEMSTGECGICRERTSRRTADRTVHISPQHVGHLPDCTHKDDDDVSLWGQATAPGAWQELCNGNPVTADAGSKVGAIAERACQTCVESYRNW